MKRTPLPVGRRRAARAPVVPPDRRLL